MIQESIVEYINAQMKLGVSRDTIKTTLTGAGWVAADVEDTLKKIESAKMAQPIATVATTPSISPSIASSPAAKPIVSPVSMGSNANPAPQTIRVSDLVSSSTSTSPVMKPTVTPASKSPLTVSTPAIAAMPAGTKTKDTFQAASYPGATKPHGSHGAIITDIVLAVIIVAVGGFAGFLYVQNNSLNAQLNSLNGQSSGVNSQLSSLQAEVAASTTALTAQVSSLTAETQELQTELSFFAVPTSTTPGSTSTATISGTVSAGKIGYIITTAYGAKIYIANSKVAKVAAALAPLMATATSTAPASASSTASSTPTVIPAAPATAAQFMGTYTPGADSIILTEVNGAAL
jgi:hypothetical protein